MKKPIRVVLAPEMLLFYDSLSEKALTNNTARILFHGISHKVEILRQNSNYGDTLAKKLIPLEYKIKHNATNLFRVELPLFWRMIYTLTNDETSIIVFIVDILDHNSYNKKFGYRGH